MSESVLNTHCSVKEGLLHSGYSVVAHPLSALCEVGLGCHAFHADCIATWISSDTGARVIGGGGSILAVPLMVYLVGVPNAHVAIGTSSLAVADFLGVKRGGQNENPSQDVSPPTSALDVSASGRIAFFGKASRTRSSASRTAVLWLC